MTENPACKKIEHSTGHHTSNTVIKILLYSCFYGALLFHEEETAMHFPYLTRQVPKSWHTSNENVLTKGRSKINLKFYDYASSKEYLVTPGIVEYNTSKVTASD